MGKRNRRRKFWYQREEPDLESLFPNTARQHRDKDVYIHEEDDGAIASPWDFNLGWDRKLQETKSNRKKNEYSNDAYKEFRSDYGSGKVWRGYDYYRSQTLSYKYVQQMANALAAQYRITVQVGNNWKVDLKKKTLIYNPASLMYGTKSELLATLMHEIGKLRYGTHPDEVKSNYLAVYKTPAVETLSIFEDIRVDYLMLKAYEGATEIYESAIPAIDQRIKEYREHSVIFRDILMKQLAGIFNNILKEAWNYAQKTGLNPQAALERNLHDIFGEKDLQVVGDRIKDIQDEYAKTGSIYDYCGEMLRIMYDSDSPESTFDNIKDKVAKTESSVMPIKKTDSTQRSVSLLDKDVFPHVEDLLRDFNRDNEKLRNAFPNMPKASAEMLMESINQNFNAATNNGHINTDQDGNSLVRSSGPTDNVVPDEWTTGDYAPLKESVLQEIRQLIQKLTFLRREELAQKHQGDQRRGKLNSKKLYKSATGNRRVFKRILPNSNTVNSFAFSVVVDRSGSMSENNRITHVSRALTIFGEVFDKMDIPFELIDFADGARHIKKFDDVYDKTVHKKIGGLVHNLGGGTNLHEGLKKMTLEKQPEKNKVCIVLTDGGVDSIEYFDREFFLPMKQRGVISMGYGIECYKDMEKLCMGNAKVLENASHLPIEFSNLLKSLIKKK